MNPLIDSALEKVDKQHAQLTQLSADAVDALNLYHTLMRQSDVPSYSTLPKMPPQQMPHQQMAYSYIPQVPQQVPPQGLTQNLPQGQTQGPPQNPAVFVSYQIIYQIIIT